MSLGFSQTLYFAYGSNMNHLQMKDRCPGARFISGAFLPDFRLRERLYADIEEKDGSEVWGAVWVLTDECEETLDLHEGVDRGVYGRWLVEATIPGAGPVECLTYIMEPGTIRRRAGRAFPDWYRRRCKMGAQHCNLGFTPRLYQDPGSRKGGKSQIRLRHAHQMTKAL